MHRPGQQPNVQQLQKKIADLERKVNALTAALQVSGTTVTLKGTNISIEAQVALTAKASSSMNLDAGGQMALKSGLIKLN